MESGSLALKLRLRPSQSAPQPEAAGEELVALTSSYTEHNVSLWLWNTQDLSSLVVQKRATILWPIAQMGLLQERKRSKMLARAPQLAKSPKPRGQL